MSAASPPISVSSLPFLSSALPTRRLLIVPNQPRRGLPTIRAALATLPVLSFSGERVGEVPLDVRVAPTESARSVVHRGLITDRQNRRRGTASTLTRGEVRGGGKKPYQQKKTGRARRGSQRTPLRPGGGVVFGPKPRDWSIKINRKEKRLAISTALGSAAAAADALVVEDFDDQFAAGPKTRDFVAAMRRWGLDPKQKAMMLMTELNDNVWLSCRNIGTLKMLTPRTLNLFDILDAQKLVFTRSSVDYLNAMYGEDATFDEDNDVDEEEEEGEGEEQEVQGEFIEGLCTLDPVCCYFLHNSCEYVLVALLIAKIHICYFICLCNSQSAFEAVNTLLLIHNIPS